jgi:hypothetical protein
VPAPSGFTFETRKDGDVVIRHDGRIATTLRGRRAADFLTDVTNGRDGDDQELMARVTGNYKRGNERLAASQRRHRR